MKTMRRRILALLILGLPVLGSTAEALPRILMLGDSTYNQPSRSIASALKGRAQVVYPPIQPGAVHNSTQALLLLDTWLGDGKWDLIHVNFGLADLVHRAPNMKSFRAFPRPAGGIRATSPAQYEKNLRALMPRLKATGASVIWSSTTPIQTDANGLFETGSEIAYNTIAERIMNEFGIPVYDMHAHVLSLTDPKRPLHPYTNFNKTPIHYPLLTRIEKILQHPPAPVSAPKK